MTHLTRIESGIDTRPIRDALACNEDLWHLDTSRQQRVSVQAQTQTIGLRQADRTRAPAHLPTEEIHPSRLVRLPPGASVGTHRDHGAYYAIRDRYHLVIESEPGGSIVGAIDREVEMHPGDLWRLPNKELHWARNLSHHDRIHFIFDVMPRTAARTRGG